MIKEHTIRPGIIATTTQTVYLDGITPTAFGMTVEPSVTREVFMEQYSNEGDHVSPQGYSFVKTETERCSGALTRVQTYPGSHIYTETVTGPVYAPDGGFAPRFDSSYNNAVSELYSQIRGGLDLSVALGESGSTMRMFRAASKLSRYILQWHPKHWAKHWLEYRYGWQPLMQDLYGSVREMSTVAPRLQRFKAKGRALYRQSKTYEDKPSGITTLVTQQEDYRTLLSTVFNPSASTLSTVARLSSLNPASIAWELTPLSFVFDWFIDIGGYLRDLESSLVYTSGFHTGFETRTSKISVVTTITGIGAISENNQRSGLCKGSVTTKTLARTALYAPPAPQLPRFTAALGSSRLVTSAALLKVFFIDDNKPTPKKRRITQLQIQRQLNRFARGPFRWSNSNVS